MKTSIIILYFIIHTSFLFTFINNFFVLPFETVYINDETISGKEYNDLLFQNELYVNLSMGTPIQNIKAILKMDKYGFIIYEDAYNCNISSTYEIVDEDLTISWVWSYISYPSKDHFYLPSFNSYDTFNKYIEKKGGNEIEHNITKANKTTFLRIHIKDINANNFNLMFHNYAIVGLQLNAYKQNFNAPEFIESLREGKNIKLDTFSLKFNNVKEKGFFYNDNRGYLIIGEELTDQENEKEIIKYTKAIKYGGEIKWQTIFDNIYSKEKNEKEIKNGNYSNEYRTESKQGNFFVNYPYILGPKEYNSFINDTFFNDLIEQNLCYINYNIHNNDYYSYICDSTSKVFMEKLNNSFPDLIFEHKELEENFTLTKNDLFSFNYFNKSDTNLYFLVMFANPKSKEYIYHWILGIPFLKKYRLSFNYEAKEIGYYKYDGEIRKKNKNEKTNNKSFFKSTTFKIICIIILVAIIFILGMICQRILIKSPRKAKANELEDDYEYTAKIN